MSPEEAAAIDAAKDPETYTVTVFFHDPVDGGHNKESFAGVTAHELTDGGALILHGGGNTTVVAPTFCYAHVPSPEGASDVYLPSPNPEQLYEAFNAAGGHHVGWSSLYPHDQRTWTETARLYHLALGLPE